MNNYFEQELRKLFGDGNIISSPIYTGRSCFGTLGKDLRVRVQFISTNIADKYDALKLTVLNRTNGPVDTMVLRLKDLLGMQRIRSNRDGLTPHIWDDHGKAEWYLYYPTVADYGTIQQAVAKYLGVFQERQQGYYQSGPKLVYICAPLRGNVEKNIEFARQKAQEVFQTGDIPVCPHLMFPPIADPDNAEQDQAAREMGLRLVASCHRLNVYGPNLTDGMLAEIQQATLLGIEVRQYPIGENEGAGRDIDNRLSNCAYHAVRDSDQ